MTSMSTTSPQTSRPTFAITLLTIGFLSSALAWWLIAPPVITFSSIAKHANHFGLVYLHVAGGTVMLFVGLANLYVGVTRKHFRYHKLIGRTYLIGGTLAALAAIAITTNPTAHNPLREEIFTNTTVSLLALATAWLLAAGMAWRAARNRRFDSHREWMIRSYVLAWSFVFCRLVSRVSAVEDMGDGNAFIWLSWVGPLIACEVSLQWRAGSGAKAKPYVSPGT